MIPKPLRIAVLSRGQGRCQYCGVVQAGQAAIFHVDHIVARSRGGATALDNLALQCPHCSLHKSNKIDGLDPETGRSTPIFHPLLQAWSEHFQLTADGAIVGKSPTGRATIEALTMNDAWPRSARALQIAIGWIRA